MRKRAVTYLAAMAIVLSVGVIVGTIIQNSQGVETNDTTNRMIQTVGEQYLRKGCVDLDDTRTTLKGALLKIINRGDRNLKKFYLEGAITKAQYTRSLKSSIDSKTDLSELQTLPCSTLTLRKDLK